MTVKWWERVMLFVLLAIVLMGAQALLVNFLPQAWYAFQEYRDMVYWGGGGAALIVLLATRRDE